MSEQSLSLTGVHRTILTDETNSLSNERLCYTGMLVYSVTGSA